GIGLASQERMDRMEEKLSKSEAFVQFFKDTSVKPVDANPILEEKGSSPMSQPDKMFKVFSRPQLELDDFMKFKQFRDYVEEHQLDDEIVEQAEIQVKYSGYIEK